MKGYVYLIDTPNSNKAYIGMTTKTLEQRLSCHKAERNKKNTPKNAWIKKHYHSLVISPLETCNLPDLTELVKELQYWEVFYIALFTTWNIPLLNATKGGYGHKAAHSEETKKLLSKIQTGRKRGEYKWTAEGKANILRGRKKLIGRKYSEETKRKMGEWQRGSNNSSYGKTPLNVIKACGMPVRDKKTGKLYRSIKNAAQNLGIGTSTVKRQCEKLDGNFKYISKETYYGI